MSDQSMNSRRDEAELVRTLASLAPGHTSLTFDDVRMRSAYLRGVEAGARSRGATPSIASLRVWQSLAAVLALALGAMVVIGPRAGTAAGGSGVAARPEPVASPQVERDRGLILAPPERANPTTPRSVPARLSWAVGESAPIADDRPEASRPQRVDRARDVLMIRPAPAVLSVFNALAAPGESR